MIGFGIIGVFLLITVAYLPTSDAVYCFLCPPKPLRYICKSVGVCHLQCLYFLAQEYGRDSIQDWTCRELVPGKWSQVFFNNEWIGNYEGKQISNLYYPEKSQNGWTYMHSAYACDTDYCNDKYRDSDPIHIGRSNGTANTATATVQLRQKWIFWPSFYFSILINNKFN